MLPDSDVVQDSALQRPGVTFYSSSRPVTHVFSLSIKSLCLKFYFFAHFPFFFSEFKLDKNWGEKKKWERKKKLVRTGGV